MKWLLSLLLIGSCALAQNKPLDFTSRTAFLELVKPIITSGELEIYKKLPDHDSRRYFEAIFWYKRDDTPGTAENAFRKAFFQRIESANVRFGTEGKPGVESDRGIVFMLLGEPDNVTSKPLPNAGLRGGAEEVWTYSDRQWSFRFIFNGTSPDYKLEDMERWKPTFEQLRNELVLDRAEPYAIKKIPLTLPHIGFTKDIENLASDDKFEIDFKVTYSFFRGDLNRTEVLMGVTPKDASLRGLDISLAAYDPFGEKVREFKKLITPQNGRFEFFSITLEPDQYTMVLRLNDKDGREGISRRNLDVPALRGTSSQASSLLLAGSLEEVPLYGFLHPKQFVFGTRYFPLRNDFTSFDGERLYIYQAFYHFPGKAQPAWFLNNKPVTAREEQRLVDGNQTRLVVSIPITTLGQGTHFIKSVYEDDAGSRVAITEPFTLGRPSSENDLLTLAKSGDAFKIQHPVGKSIAGLERVVVVPDANLKVEHMYVFLNDRLILERDRAPWETRLDEGRFSITGQNTLAVVLDTDRGLIKQERVLEPLDIKETYGTRLVQVFFNAYDKDLKFANSIDFDQIEIEVNGEPHKAKEIKKVDEPINYCFMVDVSYSMKDNFDQNISALKKFIESMRPQDKGYFVTFADHYTQIMTPNLSKAVLIAVADSLKLHKPNPKDADRLYEENNTYLYDSVIAAIHSQVQYPGRGVILMVSDGVAIEGIYRRNGMLSYARENETVIYSLWLDNNPTLSEDEKKLLETEMSTGERFARKIGLARFFTKKDARKIVIGNKVRNESITQGILKILSEESGGFHYSIFRNDREMIAEYVNDIEEACANMFVATVTLPVSRVDYEIGIFTKDDNLAIRNKSKVKVSKTNPLLD